MLRLSILKRKLDVIESKHADTLDSPNLFIWVRCETTHDARARWEIENRPLTDADRVCYIGWMTD